MKKTAADSLDSGTIAELLALDDDERQDVYAAIRVNLRSLGTPKDKARILVDELRSKIEENSGNNA